MLTISFTKTRPNALVPKRAHEHDAGYDLYSCESLIINPMERKLIPTGIAVAIPPGFYGRIAPRSGLAIKNGIDVLGGVIDSTYRAEIGVILINLNFPDIYSRGDPQHEIMGDKNKFVIKAGDRIAQLIIESCASVEFKETEKLNDTPRGVGGFGSSEQ